MTTDGGTPRAARGGRDEKEADPSLSDLTAVLETELRLLFGEDAAAATAGVATPAAVVAMPAAGVAAPPPAVADADTHPAEVLSPAEATARDAEREQLGRAERSVFDRLNERSPAALCLSGGGIRSATFSLGVLQGLARHRLLTQFHYLSTVSGGGFIGSWLSSWAQREGKAGGDPAADGGGMKVVQDKLGRSGASPADLEPDQVRHLRDYSNYLSPRLSLVSADTWTLVAIYFRNLLVTWLVFIPMLLAALLVPRLMAAVIGLSSALPGKDLRHAAWVLFALAVALVAAALHYAGKTLPSALQFWEPSPEPPAPGAAAPVAPAGSPAGVTAALAAADADAEAKRLRRLAGQSTFLWRCLAPVVASAVLFTVGWAWLPELAGSGGTSGPVGPAEVAGKGWFVSCMVVVAVVGWAATFATRLRAFKVGRVTDPDLRRRTVAYSFHQLWMLLVSAVVAGLALYGVARLLDLTPNLVNGLCDGWKGIPRAGVETAAYVCAGVPLVLAALTSGAILNVALNSRLVRPGGGRTIGQSANGDEDREWWSRFGGWVLIAGAVWFAAAAVVLVVPALLLWLPSLAQAAVAAGGGLAGVATILIGKSGVTPADPASAAPSGERLQDKVRRSAASAVLKVAAPVFIVLMLAGLSLATDLLLRGRLQGFGPAAICPVRWAEHLLAVPDPTALPAKPTCGSSERRLMQHFALVEGPVGKADHTVGWAAVKWPLLVGGWGVLLAFVSWLASTRINLNKFSLHGTFRNRLIRAYLGASHRPRVAHPFTGLDPADNLPMHELRSVRPIHVINAALNLAAGHQLAWQQRKAESFVFTPWHSGAWHSGGSELGYRDTRAYGEEVSVGTALTISGAAVSPNMGYHSSPAVAFLLTLFNVRLGCWLGNPGPAGATTYDQSAPASGGRAILAEALGLTDDVHPYVYLSDGGHFDNLALYEMIRRRCRHVVVVDAGQDLGFAFDDLGAVVRKAAVDFGVRVVVDGVQRIGAKPPAGATPGAADPRRDHYYAVGTIQYDGVNPNPRVDGTVLYIKPAYYGVEEPIDVYNYQKGCPDFPHETTADQFFSESQFESYRSLGEFVFKRIVADAGLGEDEPFTLAELLEALRRRASGRGGRPPSAGRAGGGRQPWTPPAPFFGRRPAAKPCAGDPPA